MDILDIFHNYIVKEASKGKISCFFCYSVIFETLYLETGKKLSCDKKYDNVVIPTLTIHNKKTFDELLKKYVDLCLGFYGTSNYKEEILNNEGFNSDRTSPEKLIMILLWGNATYDDFENPEEYLKKRIAFLENKIDNYENNIGYSFILNGNVDIEIEKDKLLNETPYKLCITLKSENNETYYFPEIKFGIYNDTVYFYAIQNTNTNENNYSKKVNRSLYKVNGGVKENLSIIKDISVSFVVALNIAVAFFHNLGYRNICASSILITRWNSKKIILQKKWESNKIDEEAKNSLLEKQEYIQKNLTEKFLSTFLRLQYQCSGINITSLPFDIDSNMHLKLDDVLTSDNLLLSEILDLVSKEKNKSI